MVQLADATGPEPIRTGPLIRCGADPECQTSGHLRVISPLQHPSYIHPVRCASLFADGPAEQQAHAAKGATMSSAAIGVATPPEPKIASIQAQIDRMTDDLFASLPNPENLSPEQRRGIVARYTAVLEGNFIYWMTGAYIAAGSDEARAKIMDNLREEVRDCHPGMMRRFAIAADAVPSSDDAEAVYEDLMNVRHFIGRLSAV